MFDAIDAREIVQTCAATVQQNAHHRIAGVVGTCLATVYGPGRYGFGIRFEMTRGRTEAVLELTEGENSTDPVDGTAGGVIDVASFALRVACLMLTRPPARRVMILDEPFKFVSEEYRDGVRGMLEHLAETLDIQFIMVTHIQEIACGTIHQLNHLKP